MVRSGDPAALTPAGVPNRETADALPSDRGRPPSEPVVEDQWNDVPAPPAATPSTLPPPRPRRNPAPSVRQNPDLVGGAPAPALPPFDRVRVRLPFLAAAAELDREDTRAALLEELGRDSAARVDVFVKDPARAAELLQAAARQSGLSVHADAAAADRVRTRKPTSAFLLFTESLTPAEVRDLLAKLAAADARASARVLDTVHVTALHPADQRDLHANVLGFDVNPPRKGGTDPKPIGAGTADQVAKNVAGAKPGERSAVLVAYHPAGVRTVPGLSKELVQFATRRGDRKPGAVAVVIVVRHAGG